MGIGDYGSKEKGGQLGSVKLQGLGDSLAPIGDFANRLHMVAVKRADTENANKFILDRESQKEKWRSDAAELANNNSIINSDHNRDENQKLKVINDASDQSNYVTNQKQKQKDSLELLGAGFENSKEMANINLGNKKKFADYQDRLISKREKRQNKSMAKLIGSIGKDGDGLSSYTDNTVYGGNLKKTKKAIENTYGEYSISDDDSKALKGIGFDNNKIIAIEKSIRETGKPPEFYTKKIKGINEKDKKNVEKYLTKFFTDNYTEDTTKIEDALSVAKYSLGQITGVSRIGDAIDSVKSLASDFKEWNTKGEYKAEKTENKSKKKKIPEAKLKSLVADAMSNYGASGISGPLGGSLNSLNERFKNAKQEVGVNPNEPDDSYYVDPIASFKKSKESATKLYELGASFTGTSSKAVMNIAKIVESQSKGFEKEISKEQKAINDYALKVKNTKLDIEKELNNLSIDGLSTAYKSWVKENEDASSSQLSSKFEEMKNDFMK